MRYSIILPYYNRKEYLSATLQSLSHFYGNRRDVEIVVVDDGSDDRHRVDDLVTRHSLHINLVRIDNKRGINPCYPYNVGARKATGDVLILSSPETIHTNNIFELCGDFAQFSDSSYYLFSVFCTTDGDANKRLLADSEFVDKLLYVKNVRDKMYLGLGEQGRPEFNNEFGSWYLHSRYRHTHLNFLSAVSKKTFSLISGFDESFRFGTGFDDTEFADRLIPNTPDIQYFDGAEAIHLNHPPVYKGSPITNERLYFGRRKNPYQTNDGWGRL